MKTLTTELVKKDVLTEREVLLIKNRFNKEGSVELPYEYYQLTPDQCEKGYKWLLNLWKTPRGVERKHNPFGYREEDILENYSHFTLAFFHDCANYMQAQMGMRCFVPVYNCIAKDGDSFQYYVWGGEINIIG